MRAQMQCKAISVRPHSGLGFTVNSIQPIAMDEKPCFAILEGARAVRAGITDTTGPPPRSASSAGTTRQRLPDGADSA